jgi:hypothetical protein
MSEELLMHLETSLLQRCSESERQWADEVNDAATLAWRISSGGRGESVDHSHSSNSGKVHAVEDNVIDSFDEVVTAQ